MKPKKLLLNILATAVMAVLPAASSLAQAFPTKPITMIVPFEAGAVFDAFARLLSKTMQDRGHPGFVIDNRPGANAIIGTQACARARPDGYTVCMLARDNISLLPWETNVGYDPVKDLAPVTNIAIVQTVLFSSATVPANNFQEFIAHSKRNPERVFYTAFSSAQLSMEWVRRQSGAPLTFVPYRGGATGMQALLGDQIQAMLMAVGNPGLMQLIESGKVRPLAVPSARRYASLPNVPTFMEVGLPKFPLDSWMGLFAPAGMPKNLREQLARDVAEVLRNPEFQEKSLRPRGLDPVGNTPEEFGQFITEDRERGKELIKLVGARQF